jgi:hypothetical protein
MPDPVQLSDHADRDPFHYQVRHARRPAQQHEHHQEQRGGVQPAIQVPAYRQAHHQRRQQLDTHPHTDTEGIAPCVRPGGSGFWRRGIHALPATRFGETFFERIAVAPVTRHGWSPS